MACTGNEGCHDAADEVAGAPSSLRHNTTDGRLSVDLITKSRQRPAPRQNLQDPRPQEMKAGLKLSQCSGLLATSQINVVSC